MKEAILKLFKKNFEEEEVLHELFLTIRKNNQNEKCLY